ncbi:hypothetical protein [Desulfobulbus sp.]|uniref:hypothetical protein n=1 Tax=Desulfobulbus sp. TaxID=895 RepID=UPI0027B9A470|nr:hypothetical protein [Desulfobulbus sp.]
MLADSDETPVALNKKDDSNRSLKPQACTGAENKVNHMAIPKKILKKKYAENFCAIMLREHPDMTDAINMDTVFFYFNAGVEVHDAVNKYMEFLD